MVDFTIGADIEVMLEKKGTLISAVPILVETLKLPHGEIFADNVLAEFTITPATSREAFITHIQDNLKATKKIFEADKIGLRIVSSAHYPVAELQSDKAKEFGCNPDFCAYRIVKDDFEPNVVERKADATTLRTAGAHVHVGHPIFADISKLPRMVMMMDLYLGVPSVIWDNTPEAKERRILYGKAGAHRPKEYPGPEYRPLSNWWIKDARTIGWVYDRTARSLSHIIKGDTVESLGFDPEEVRRVINEGDEVAAKAICLKIDTIKDI
jgi:hypothetical protein